MDILFPILILLILIIVYILVKESIPNLSIISKITVSVFIFIFVLSVIIHPGESFSAALDGLKVWFNIVFPSLLPFFIGSELLINLGVVNFIGILLEPVMRPVFNVPGCGSFPFVMSITSGYPVGAKVVSELYKSKMCNKAEAQRLLSFCSTSGPLFMIGAVAIGMLNVESSGPIIALSNYLGAVTVGLIFRFYKYRQTRTVPQSGVSFKKALNSLVQSLNKENRPFGLLLSDAVRNSINTILLIGGLIVLFSVIIKLVVLSGLTGFISKTMYSILSPLGVDRILLDHVASGLFEITIGARQISSSMAPLSQKIIAISGIIAWSGFSIHAQVAGVISNTDLKAGVYILSKAVHSIMTCIFSYIIISIWGIHGILSRIPVFGYGSAFSNINIPWISRLIISTGRYFYIILFLILSSLVIMVISKVRFKFNR